MEKNGVKYRQCKKLQKCIDSYEVDTKISIHQFGLEGPTGACNNERHQPQERFPR